MGNKHNRLHGSKIRLTQKYGYLGTQLLVDALWKHVGSLTSLYVLSGFCVYAILNICIEHHKIVFGNQMIRKFCAVLIRGTCRVLLNRLKYVFFTWSFDPLSAIIRILDKIHTDTWYKLRTQSILSRSYRLRYQAVWVFKRAPRLSITGSRNSLKALLEWK